MFALLLAIMWDLVSLISFLIWGENNLAKSLDWVVCLLLFFFLFISVDKIMFYLQFVAIYGHSSMLVYKSEMKKRRI